MIDLGVSKVGESQLGIELREHDVQSLGVRAGDTLLVTGGPLEYKLRVASPATVEALPHIHDAMSRFAGVLGEMHD